MSHLEKLCENHCHLHQNHVQSTKAKKKNQEKSQLISSKPGFRPSMDWRNKSTRKLPIPIMVPPPPKVLSVQPGKLYQTLEGLNQNKPGFNNDISPSVAARRVQKLIENLQFVEAANFVHKLNHTTFKLMLEELSFVRLIQFIPNSLPTVEAIYSKMFVNSRSEEPISLEKLHPQEIVDSLINLFVPTTLSQWDKLPTSMRDKILDESSILSAKRILKVIMLFDNRIRKQIDLKKRQVDRALRGLGHHGLVGTSNDTLIELNDAVRIELEKLGNQYKATFQKLLINTSSGNSTKPQSQVSSKSSISKGPAPIESSHQRQLSLKLKDIQERLVENSHLLNVIEGTIGNNNTLQILLDNLRNRIEMDKEAITQVIQVGKLVKKIPQRGESHHQHHSNQMSNSGIIDPETILAPILIKYSAAYSNVLTLFKELDTEGRSSQQGENVEGLTSHQNYNSSTAEKESESRDCDTISGYHSDSDHSNNTTPSSTDNHISASIVISSAEFGIKESSFGTPYCNELNGIEVTLRSTNWDHRNNSSPDIHLLPHEIPPLPLDDYNPRNKFPPDTFRNISLENDSLRRELALNRKSLSDMQQRQRFLLQRLSNQERTVFPQEKNEILNAIRAFANLYAESRIEVWNTLNILDEDQDYKSNVILSILITSFNVTRKHVSETKGILSAILNIDHSEPSTPQFLAQLNSFMIQSRSTLESSKCFQNTWKSICESFPEMISLNQSKYFNAFVGECVKIAWYFAIQKQEVELKFGDETFSEDYHVHFQGLKNVGSKRIRSYLWPALCDTSTGSCVHKAIVVTM